MERTRPQRTQKLGEKVCAQIADEIISGNWSPDQLFGTERDLLQKYAVSRNTLREAIRQLEKLGVAKITRGPKGGLTTSSPTRKLVARALSNYFEIAAAPLAEMHVVRVLLEEASVRLAAQRITPEEGIALREEASILLDPSLGEAELVRRNMAVRLSIARSSKNPALPLFISALDSVPQKAIRATSGDPAGFRRALKRASETKCELVEAIFAGDEYSARALIREDAALRIKRLKLDLESEESDADSTWSDTPAPEWEAAVMHEERLADRVAHAILLEITRESLSSGANLGTESALQEKYEVGRGVLREAIRQLEPHGVVEMRAGISGGLIVGRPDPSYTINLVSVYLRSLRVELPHLWEISSILGPLAVELLSQNYTYADSEGLTAVLSELLMSEGEDFVRLLLDVQREIAARSRNQVLDLFVTIILDVGSQKMSPIPRELIEGLKDENVALVEAILSGDTNLARRVITHMLYEPMDWNVSRSSQ